MQLKLTVRIDEKMGNKTQVESVQLGKILDLNFFFRLIR